MAATYTRKPLNLTDDDRRGVVITYNVNRFEVYHRDGWLMESAQDKRELKAMLAANRITGAQCDSLAQRKWLYG